MMAAPQLLGRSVVVLSNNNGCIVSRTAEAKALGIGMAQPAFQVADILRRHDVAVFSSNYALYGDMSRRVMQTLATFAPQLEIYSIDEAFLRLDGVTADVIAFGHHLRATVAQWTGIPVSVGVGPTKTLAKLANQLAKMTGRGVVSLDTGPAGDRLLATLPVGKIWGIGRRMEPRLRAAGFHTALDLKQRGRSWLRAARGVVGERMWLELNGLSCLPLEELPQPRQSIASTRSFGHPVMTLAALQEALATYASRAGEKLRRGQQLAGAMQVFFQTNRFQPHYRQWAKVIPLPEPTADSRLLAASARAVAARYYRDGLAPLQKAGVILLDLMPAGEGQGSLFTSLQPQRSAELMQALDTLNRRFGRDTVRLASSGTRRDWQMRQHRRSPYYTTDWREIVRVGGGGSGVGMTVL